MGLSAGAGVSASGTPSAGDGANAVVSGIITDVGPTRPFAFRGQVNVALYASYNTALTTTSGSFTASVAVAGAIADGTAVRGVNVPPGTTFGTFTGPSGTLAMPTRTLWGYTSAGSTRIGGIDETSGLQGAAVAGPGIPGGATVLEIVQASVAGTIHAPPIPGIVRISAAVTSAPVDRVKQPFTFALGAGAIVSGVDAAAIFTGASITYTADIQLEQSFDGGLTWIFVGAVPQKFHEAEKHVLYRLNCTAYTSGTINYRLSQTGAAATALDLSPA